MGTPAGDGGGAGARAQNLVPAFEGAALRTLSRAFLESWPIDRLCNTFANDLVTSLAPQFAAVLLFDASTAELVNEGFAGKAPAGEWTRRKPASELLAGDVLASGVSLVVEDVQQSARATFARLSGVRAYVAVPMRSHEGVVGVIVAGDTRERPDLLGAVGAIEGLAAHLAQGITRRRAEDALAASELRFRTVFDESRDAIGVSLRGVHVFVNPAYVALFGYDSAAQLVGRPIIELIAPADRRRILANVSTRAAGDFVPNAYPCRGLRRDGEEFDMDVRVSTYAQHGDHHTLVMLRDITEQARAQRALEQSERRHRDLFDQVPVGLWEEDLSAVKVALDALDDDARRDLRAWLRAHPEMTARCAASARVLHVNKTAWTMLGATSEPDLLGNLGRVFAPESLGPFGDALAIMYAGAERFRVEGVNRTLQGETRWVDLRGSFAEGHAHDWSKILISTIDITELKRAEAERSSLVEQLEHARRMEAIGTLAGGVAHDFNNILAAIVGFGELAQLQCEPRNPIRDDLVQILKAANRARDLVQQILAFSRRAVQARKRIDVATVVQDAAKLLRAATPANVELRVTIAPDAGEVLADVTQLHQVLMNLVTNARWAVRDQPTGLLEIVADSAHFDTSLTLREGRLEPGDYVRVRVRDDGCGMDEATLLRLFEPYFTSKAVGEGSGLGLSVVHGIVASHGGAIDVASSPGTGSTFDVFLPKLGDRERLSDTPPADTVQRGAERVLFVDDEPDVAQVCTRMLERAGYKVTSTTSAIEALEVFRARPGEFDIVVTDQSMPHMTGAAIAAEMLSIRKDLPIIVCTGYSETLDEAKALRIGARKLLMKPLDMKTLTRAIRQVLDSDE